MEKIGHFRPWVKKMMPTVYDDTLTYYELLTKVIGFLNQVIDQGNELVDFVDIETTKQLAEIKKIHKEFVEVKLWLDNEVLPENIAVKLEDWYDSGKLGEIINQEVFDMKPNFYVSKTEPQGVNNNTYWLHDIGEGEDKKINLTVSNEEPDDKDDIWFKY